MLAKAVTDLSTPGLASGPPGLTDSHPYQLQAICAACLQHLYARRRSLSKGSCDHPKSSLIGHTQQAVYTML